MSKRTKILIFVLVLVCVVLMVCYLCRGSGTVKGSSKPVPRRPGEATAVDTSKVAKEEEEQVAWMELPASSSTGDDRCVITHTAQMEGRSQRNYTILYDDDLYAALWVAYPLCASHTSSGREETWGYDPKLSKSAQTNVKKGYGASEPTVNYPKNFYARGHQIPNADRSAVPEMQAQTYYSTNMTPQLQNGFNGNIWAKLEEAVRMEIPEGDTLYVVTGAVFEKYGADEDVNTSLKIARGFAKKVLLFFGFFQLFQASSTVTIFLAGISRVSLPSRIVRSALAASFRSVSLAVLNRSERSTVRVMPSAVVLKRRRMAASRSSAFLRAVIRICSLSKRT